MTQQTTYEIHPIGVVRSTLERREDAPRQGWAGAPDAWIELDDAYRDGLLGVEQGTELVILTWFHLADRAILQVRPHHDPEQRVRGVFVTRSPVRPNPVGIHPVRVLEVDGTRLHVEPLEAVDGTPVVDIKVAMQNRYEDAESRDA